MKCQLPFPEQKETLSERAHRWMREHPETLDLFWRFAEQMRKADRPFGFKMLAERVRWECHLTTRDAPKLNNSYTAYVARWLAKQDPRLAPLIRCRVTPAAHRPARDPNMGQRVDPITEDPIDEGDE